jgi:hypothetical protein
VQARLFYDGWNLSDQYPAHVDPLVSVGNVSHPVMGLALPR